MATSLLSEDHLEILLEKLYKEKGWDFRSYRKYSLRRCIERRLSSVRLPSQSYIELLDSRPSEFNHLFNQITIKVSEFFRDPQVFNKIGQYEVPSAINRLKAEGRDTLRVWSCGCARGEEAYSMAMLLAKKRKGCTLSCDLISVIALSALHTYPYKEEEFKVKIFATDIDETSIDIARKGIYSEDCLKNVDLALKHQFFKSVDNGYQVIPLVRNLVTFGVHDIISDIHLSHMDIILCRNLLIYFEKDLQERVFEKFFYSLNKGGYIILGRSEVVPAPYRNGFKEVFRKERIYQKI